MNKYENHIDDFFRYAGHICPICGCYWSLRPYSFKSLDFICRRCGKYVEAKIRIRRRFIYVRWNIKSRRTKLT